MEKLSSDTYYHIYNRGNNRERIFYKDSNYIFFLRNFDSYLSKYLDLYAYCLLQNHFHLLIKTKSNESRNLQNENYFGDLVGEEFRKFFMKYSKAINNQENRTGSLFKKLYQRKALVGDGRLIKAILYIHLNPVHHNISADYINYRWSSYNKILSKEKSKIKKNEVINLFEGIENYVSLHNEYKEFVTMKENQLDEMF